MSIENQNAFLRFAALGYSRFVPIVPPDAKIYERSTLNRQLGLDKDPRGKTPGLKNSAGEWYGFDFVHYESDETDLTRWHAMGAGVGIKTGNGLVLIDADTTNKDLAKIIVDEIKLIMPTNSVRIGQYPKAGYLVRTDPDFRYAMIGFGDANERVEILAEGKQFVAHGIHPKTLKPYFWPNGIPAYADLPFLSTADLLGLLDRLAKKLPASTKISREGAATSINQSVLKGGLETIRQAVKAMPNSHENFPRREDYRNVGYAIKAALQDYPHEAFEVFSEWCADWTGPDGKGNDPDTVASDWRRMQPPYRRGAQWLYEEAERLSNGRFTQAHAWFEDLSEVSLNPFDELEHKQVKKDTFPLVTVGELIHRPPPSFLIGRHIVERSVGFIYSEPGIGKTFLALDMALSIAAGLQQWHGDPIHAPANAAVVYIASEGSYGFRNRIKAWMQERSIDQVLLNRFYIIEKTINFMDKEDIEKLVRTVKAVEGVALALVVVDTVSRAIPGADENLQKDMTLFVNACDRVRDTFGCAVLGVHHAGKSGDMRGSTVLRGAGDFVFRLDRKKGVSVGRFECEKMKDAPDGWSDQYAFGPVDLDDGQSSLVIGRIENGVGPGAKLTAGSTASVLLAMREAWHEGEPWSKSPRCKPPERYAVKRMVSDFGFDGAAAEQTLAMWESMGVVVIETRDRKNSKTGFKVAVDPGQFVQNDGLFD